jgi:hypothetical protein
LFSALGVLSLENHLSLGALTQHGQHVEGLLSGCERGQEFLADELHHVDYGLLGLTATFDQHCEPLTHFSQLLVGPGQL